ncbi:MAG: tRNA (adenosine(37)-N6)-threonylcarbamoyltransferase complex ATPase subunit type 1 TsaE, partial [Gammaproteobacteria bacterium]
TFVRECLKCLGHTGIVKSPSYAIIEPYLQLSPPVLHLDLYRMDTLSDLDYLGLRDYMDQKAIWFIEWPKNHPDLPAADYILSFEFNGPENTRTISFNSFDSI